MGTEGIIWPDFNIQYEFTLIKTVWFCLWNGKTRGAEWSLESVSCTDG